LIHSDKISEEILNIINERVGTDRDKFKIPPPVFMAMKGEFVSFSLDESYLRCKFPVLAEQLNPYGHMQGGIVSAAIDNTIGPLSMLIASTSVTRKMEVKYSSGIEADVDFIYVTAKFLEKKKRFLYFEAIVDNETETIKYATSKSTHWII